METPIHPCHWLRRLGLIEVAVYQLLEDHMSLHPKDNLSFYLGTKIKYFAPFSTRGKTVGYRLKVQKIREIQILLHCCVLDPVGFRLARPRNVRRLQVQSCPNKKIQQQAGIACTLDDDDDTECVSCLFSSSEEPMAAYVAPFYPPNNPVRHSDASYFTLSRCHRVKMGARCYKPHKGSECLPVRKQATQYCSSSSDDGLEWKPSKTRKTKRTLRRNRKLEKETKQLVKQEELKRLHKAQAIQRLLEEVEEKQRDLEVYGVQLEKELRGESDSRTQDETQLLHEWFELVLEKNKLMRYESELLIM
ncbi:MICAL C-terminal-like protein [Varanus komodoensis]|nr:MICAL C-terminal-like protein [Varanus komodoensis]